MAPLTLYYFDFPGRGETARLLLTIGGVEFVDKRFTFADWPSLKASMPFHQVPVLQLEDGSQLAQMAAIDRYCAAITGMMPSDPWDLAMAEQAYCFIADIWEPLGTALAVEGKASSSPEEKAQAWQQLLAPEGTFKQRLKLLNDWLAKNCKGKFVACDQLMYVDLSVFGTLSMLQSGWMAGIPCDILCSYPALAAFRNAVAAAPAVAAYYAQESDEVRQRGFTPAGAAAAEAPA